MVVGKNMDYGLSAVEATVWTAWLMVKRLTGGWKDGWLVRMANEICAKSGWGPAISQLKTRQHSKSCCVRGFLSNFEL